MRIPLFACLLLLALPVPAALVDNGSFTTDTNTGLDWLDLSETVGIGFSAALAANTGWRLATNDEVEALFGQTFDGYYDTDLTKFRSIDSEGAYADQAEDAANWISLFGATKVADFAGFPDLYSWGVYVDEDGWVRSTGARVFGEYPATYFDSTIRGLEYSPSLTNNSWYPSHGETLDEGVFMVRSSVVPIPAAVWLFGSALTGLGWLRRIKTA